MLCLADIEGGRDEKSRFLAARLPMNSAPQRVGAHEPGRPVLLRRADRNEDGFRLRQIGLDLGQEERWSCMDWETFAKT